MALNISSVTSLPKYSFNEAKSLLDRGFNINEIIPNMNPKYVGNMVTYGLENAKNPDAYWLSLSPELREANYKLYENYKTNQANQMFSNAEANGIVSSIASNNKLDLLDIYNKEADNRALARDRAYGLDITNSTFQGISSLTNMGLGIWNAYQQSQTAKKQIELADEQIAASKELRDQRAKEIERLNRVRGNTAKAYNTGSVITRSY